MFLALPDQSDTTNRQNSPRSMDWCPQKDVAAHPKLLRDLYEINQEPMDSLYVVGLYGLSNLENSLEKIVS